MKNYAKLFRALEETTKTNTKIAALADYFGIAPDKDKVWTIAILSHRRPKRTVSTALLREWAAEVGNIPPWLFEESYHVVGDLAETIALVVDGSQSAVYGPQSAVGGSQFTASSSQSSVQSLQSPPAQLRYSGKQSLHAQLRYSGKKSLSTYIEAIKSLKDKTDEEKKAYVLLSWAELDFYGRFLFNKLITGGLRVGVSQKVMLKALAKATDKDAESLAHRIAGNWNPEEVTFQDLIFSESLMDDLSKPYPFFLAYALEQEIHDLGNVSDWQIERKWDGIRGQLISRGGEIFVWSRGEELISDSFPEFQKLQDTLPEGIVIDGEIIVWNETHPANFNALQKRIGRKKPGKKILKDNPVVMIAYDILEWQGIDVRNKPMQVRRGYLEKLFESLVPDQPLILSEELNFENWNDVKEEWALSREKHCEGFMLKNQVSPYLVGRKKGHWWKWKVEPFTVDAVMLYAQSGHGRRANLFTDYTFAVWDGDLLVPIAKAYSGLTDKEFQEITRWVRKNTKDRFGPVRSVKPELVFEIAFEGIAHSTRHKSGVALRFPRMKRWRKDKRANEADQLETLKQLIQK